MANVPRSGSRRLRDSWPDSRRTFNTSNVWPRRRWNGWVTVAEPKERLASSAVRWVCGNAEHPLRAVRFWDVRPADRRRAIATGLDAFEKVQQVGLQVRLIVLRRDAVDAGSAVLAGQPVGLPHPIQIDDVVERAQRRSPFRLRQIGYPLSVRGQVCRVQSPLLCFRSTVLYSWRLPSLRRVPASPVPRLHR